MAPKTVDYVETELLRNKVIPTTEYEKFRFDSMYCKVLSSVWISLALTK